MANIKSLFNDEQNKLNTTGESTVINNDSGSTVDPTASQAQTSGNWTNLSKYLDANHGLGGNVGNAVTADSQSKIDSAAGKINDYQQKASQVDKSQTDKLAGYQTQIANDPTKINAGQFKTDLATGYGGNTDATRGEGYGDAFNAYGGAKDGYDSLKGDDWANRTTAVKDTFGKNNAQYSKGMNLLDTFVLQGDQSGKDAINGFVNKNAGTFAGDGRDSLTTARTGVQSALDSEKNRFGGYVGDTGSLTKALADKKMAATSAVTGRQSQADAANTLLDEKQGVLSSLANELKTNRGQANASYSPDGSRYTAGDYSTDEDKATLDALSALGAGEYDKGLVTKTGKGAGSLSYDSGVGNANVKTEYDYDPTANQLKTRSITDKGPSNWTTMGVGGSGSVGTWLDTLLKSKGY